MVAGLPTTERNLILTGYIEPNKPRIGRQVATTLNMKFVDMEEKIETRLGDDIDTIRAQYGERRLKATETELMDEIMLYRNTVVRINGSTLTHSDHLERVQLTSTVIVLAARLDAILQRLHLMLGARYHNPSERAVAVGELRRQWAVRRYPGIYEIDATDLTEPQMVEAVIALWRQVSLERA